MTAGKHDPCLCFGAWIDQVWGMDGSVWVVDLKTGARVQPAYPRQVAGAAIAYRQQLGVLPRRGILVLREDGSFDERRDWHPCTRDEDAVDVLAAARVYHDHLREGRERMSVAHDRALYRQDGTRVPGIGSVLKGAGYVHLDGIPAGILERARAKGAAVHAAIEYIEADDLDEASVAPELAGYLRSYLTAKAELAFEVRESEYGVVYDCRHREARAEAGAPEPPRAA